MTSVAMLGIQVDALTLAGAVERAWGWIAERGGGCRYVVTPNADHVVLVHENGSLRRAYDSADMVLADGWPLVAASWLLRRPLPGRVAGSDLVPALFASATADRPLRAFLLGGAAGVPERAAERIAERWPHVEVVGLYSPPLGFERDAEENARILDRIEAAAPDALIVGLGAPKQEIWVHAHRRSLAAPVALCVGATIDFLAGQQTRAPGWMQCCGLEWLHRLASDPRRLALRYLRDAAFFPPIVLRQLAGLR